jgi:hypothetical protein
VATFDWKYLICSKGNPSWGEFAVEHVTWATDRDLDCTRVAEVIVSHVGASDDATLCLEDMFGNRHEVDVARQECVRYESCGFRDLGKVEGLRTKNACSDEFTAKQTVRDQVLGRMIDQSRALAQEPCEFDGEPCYGCATCYARETVRMLSVFCELTMRAKEG